jgi:hypothetical protein
MQSELIRLSLLAPLRYKDCAVDIMSMFSAKNPGFTEGREWLFQFDRTSVIADGPDGPKVRLPLPNPARTASKPEGSDCGNWELAEGVWLFMQDRPKSIEALADFIERFEREIWWEGLKAEETLFARFVHEDGRLAAQLLRRTVF